MSAGAGAKAVARAGSGALVAAALALPGALSAAPPAAAPTPAVTEPCLVLAGATVHLPDGPRDGVTVVVTGDRIAAAATSVPGLGAPAGGQVTFGGRTCAFEDAAGTVVTPGFVEPGLPIGLLEVSLEEDTVHTGAERADPVRASLRAWDAYDPHSALIPVARLEGVTSVVTAPGGGLVSGQSAWVRLAGATQAEALVKAPVAVHAHLGGLGTPAEGLGRLRELLEDARDFARDRAAWARNASRPFGWGRLDLEAMLPVARGTLPLVVDADRAADLEALARLAREQGVKVVARGAAEGWKVAPSLAQAGVAAIVDPLVYGPGSFDQIHARRDNAALLHRAGVRVMFSTFSPYQAGDLRLAAGNAAREGLDRAAAVQAVTRVPAEVFGLADRGRIAPGAAADLVVWTGDPFELGTWARRVVIGGRDVPLRSRQTALFEKYRRVPAP